VPIKEHSLVGLRPLSILPRLAYNPGVTVSNLNQDAFYPDWEFSCLSSFKWDISGTVSQAFDLAFHYKLLFTKYCIIWSYIDWSTDSALK
jgi:hypothetical protein